MADTPAPAQLEGVALLLCTNAGLEDIVRAELLEHGLVPEEAIACSPWDLRGYVALCGVAAGAVDGLVAAAHRLHSVHDVLQYHNRFDLPPADGPVEQAQPEDYVAPAIQRLCEWIKELPEGVPTLEGAESFRVTCERVGAHEFHGFVLEREVGEVLHERYGVRGDMKHPAVTVRVEVVLRTALLATQRNAERISRRHKTAFVHKSSLNPVVAYAMVKLAQIRPGNKVLDPFCGGATILCEIAQHYGTEITLFGSDLNKRVVEGARSNCTEIPGITFAQVNGRLLHKHYPLNTFDVIVTNLPWGVRVAAGANVDNIYKGFLWAAWQVLKPGGTLCLLVLTVMAVLEEARRNGLWVVEHSRVIKTGDLLPSILVLRKQQDMHWQGLSAQRRELTQYTRARAAKKARGATDTDVTTAEDVDADAPDVEAADGAAEVADA